MSPRGAAHRPSAFAAVDLGASSGRVVLGMLRGRHLDITEVHRFENRPLSIDGRLQWDVEQLFAETLTGLGAAVRSASARGAQVRGIGVDSWGVDFALLDDAGRVTGPVLHHRGVADAAPAIRRRRLPPQQVYERTGVPDHPINTSLRLSDLAAAGIARDRRVLFVPDLWVSLLTGASGTDPTIASTGQLLDPASQTWARDIIAASGIEALRLPSLQPPGTVAGRTTPAVTARLGAAAPVPVFRVAGHDTASAFAFATPTRMSANEHVDALISSGTWSIVGACVPQPIRSEAAHASGFVNECGVEGTLLVQNLNGMWILQECLREWSEQDGRAPELAELLAQAERAGRDDRTFDVASRSLLASGGMVGRVTALAVQAARPAPRSRGQIVRAILDSLAAAYARSITALEQLTGTRRTRVRILGGGSRNRLLCQLTADATGLPVLAGPAEASSIGNIAVQARASSGASTGLTDFYDHLTGDGTDTARFEPSGQEVR